MDICGYFVLGQDGLIDLGDGGAPLCRHRSQSQHQGRAPPYMSWYCDDHIVMNHH